MARTRKYLVIIFIIFQSSLSFSQEDISYVNVRGYGESLNESRITAARAALSEYVGTFIDASYSVEEKIVIENDYVTESSLIEENIFEYSQGVIMSIDVISVVESYGFYEIEARVGLSKQATETFITEKLSEIREVSSGLFASIVTNRENRLGQFGIFTESVWKPLIDNSAIDAGIVGEIVEATLAEYSNKSDAGNIVLKIPVAFKIKDEYLNRAISSLENIAKYDEYTRYLFYDDDGVYPTVRDYDLAPIARVIIGNFGYPERGSLAPIPYKSNPNHLTEPRLLLPATSKFHDVYWERDSGVKLYTVQGETANSLCDLIETPFSSQSLISHSISFNLEFLGDSGVLHSENISVSERKSGYRDFSLLTHVSEGGGVCRFFIDTISEIEIFVEVSDSVLSDTKDIRIQML